MVKFLRWLLFPFTLLYTMVILIRNWAYDNQLLRSRSFRFPVIVIGNLSVGGTGKSPMTEYVLRLIESQLRVAVLSRGYGRKTKGFRYVETLDKASTTGDEPLQIKRKFPNTTVAVCENRVQGILQLQDHSDAVLLDDAYQHRRLRPSFSILLFDYESLQHAAIPLPTGNFREPLAGCKRADLIVITKCPPEIPEQVKFTLEAKFRKHTSVPLFYTKIAYKNLQTPDGLDLENTMLSNIDTIVLTGIAKPQPLHAYLRPHVKSIIPLTYPDHHRFSDRDLHRISETYLRIDTQHKIIVTTEKDIQRLPADFLNEYPVYFLPIEQTFLFDQAPVFDAIVKRAFSY